MDLYCPENRQLLTAMTLAAAQDAAGPLCPRKKTPFGATKMVLLREDHKAAYPIVNEMPILLVPEALTTEPVEYDLRDRRWSEAYEEMDFYNISAADIAGNISQALVDRLVNQAAAAAFPYPEWLDAPYDAASQLDAFRYLGTVKGQRVAQLGGKGVHAVKSLLAGAQEAWLLTPMHQEAAFAYELARQTGVASRFHTVVAIAEQMPFPDEAFDAIYAGGCLHHMSTDFAGPEIRRVLVKGGRFAAVEPWDTAAHQFGTRAFGKREVNVYCRPLDEERLRPLELAFNQVEIRHHGPILRYLALGLLKVTKHEISTRLGLWLARADDALPLPAHLGGSVAVLATRH
jgi:SAM-dependent methyltransferase/uncharacterized protein YbaR (Trm112 family)